MLTNLLCSITVALVTNTVSVVPMQLISLPPEDGPSTLAVLRGRWEPIPNPNVRTNVTTCTEVTTLKFDWNGIREVKSERVLWSTSIVERLEWQR